MTTGEALRVLGLPSRVQWQEVRQAYLDLVRVWHPDRFQSDPSLQARAAKRLAEINEAYDFLSSVHASQRSAVNRPTAQAPPSPEPPKPRRPTSGPSQQRDRQPSTAAPSESAPSAEPDSRNIAYGVMGAFVFAILFGIFIEWVEQDPDSSRPEPDRPFVTSVPTGVTPPEHRTMTASPARSPEPLRVAYAQTLPGVERPASGTQFLVGTSGLGTLTITNGTARDAVVVMYEGDLQRRAVYVRARGRAAVPQVAVGTYTVRFTTGAWWNGEEFLQETTFSEFERSLNFEETPKSDSIAYSDFELTLQPVVGGNARTHTTAPFRLVVDVAADGP